MAGPAMADTVLLAFELLFGAGTAISACHLGYQDGRMSVPQLWKRLVYDSR